MSELDRIRIRKADIEDLDDVLYFRMIFLNDYKDHDDDRETMELRKNTRKYLEKAMRSESFIAFLAYDKGKVVASGGMEIREVTPRYGSISRGLMGYIMNMYTLPSYRNRGIGTEILDLLKEEAKEREVGFLHLHASRDGDSIYRRGGFRDHELPELVFEVP